MPFSPGCQRDDKFIKTVSHLLNTDVVITEKLDGGNVCLESEDVFARSHEGPPSHPSFGELKALHSTLKYQIPQDVQVFGEWCLAIKSLEYTEVLPAYLVCGNLGRIPKTGLAICAYRLCPKSPLRDFQVFKT